MISRRYSRSQLYPAGRATQSGRQTSSRTERGQALVILAVSFLALLAFVGLVTDVGALYTTYTQLKRAVDAAAVAAANNIKIQAAGDNTANREKIENAAREMLALNDVTDITSLTVVLCDDASRPADFAAMCPQSPESPRKLAYIQATQLSPVYFMSLFGIQAVPITLSSVGEAATVDLVIVLDTSESMASDSCEAQPPGDSDPPCTSGFDPNSFNPAACNSTNTCYPMRQAKDAAKSLVQRLLPGYDQVAVVTFDYQAHVISNLNTDMGALAGAIDTIGVHNDAPTSLLTWYYQMTPTDPPEYATFNPIFPDDRDGNGSDDDPGLPCTDEVINANGLAGRDLWDDDTGQPCDDDDILDAYDWNNNYDPDLNPAGHDDDDIDNNPGTNSDVSILSTCIGCGVRQAVELLQAGGRQASVWVIVLLSDGIPNLSDMPSTYAGIPGGYRYGFCGSNPPTSYWSSFCIDNNETRYCLDDDASECPPDSTHTTTSGPYSVKDYAFDMIDEAGLLVSTNPNEPLGEDIVMYSIALDAARSGADVLRYMANLGVDGDRDPDTDECDGVAATENCGNYYYAPTAEYLDRIFESIAANIFTKISR